MEQTCFLRSYFLKLSVVFCFCFLHVFLASAFSSVEATSKYIRTSQVTNGHRIVPSFNVETQKVTIQPFVDTMIFEGTTTIIGHIQSQANPIILHSKHLQVALPKILVNSQDVTSNVTLKLEEEKDFLVLTFDNDLTSGDLLEINIMFQGKMNEDIHGLYRGSYLDEEGQTRYFMATQMGLTHAREVFPCMDEPIHKPKFSLNVIREEKYSTISNMPMNRSVQITNNLFQDSFVASEKMPAYLYSFFISEFGKESTSINSVFAQPQTLTDNRLDLVLETANLAIQHYAGRMGVQFILPKLDHVAIPNLRTPSLFMENLGLISYKEELLVNVVNQTTTEEKQNLVAAVARQVCQQWHNLVTPWDWSGIWLNLGLGIFMEYTIVPLFHGSWQMVDQFVVKNMHSALYDDSFLSTRPLRRSAETPEEILDLLDNIGYNKGAGVLKTLRYAVGYTPFYSGVGNFLNKYSHGSADEEELYEEMQALVDAGNVELPASVSDIMTSWSTQEGYPLLRVQRTDDGFTLSQSRFLLDPEESPPTETLWCIPFGAHSQEGESRSGWLTEATSTIIWPTSDKWVIFNRDRQSFFRVLYDDYSWELIIEALDHQESSISLSDKAMLIDDAFNLARANLLPYETVFKLFKFVDLERKNYIQMYSYLDGVSYILHMLKDSIQLSTFVALSLLQTVSNLGTNLQPSDSHTDILNRIAVIKRKCLQYPSCWDLLSSLEIPPDLQEAAYCGGMYSGGVTEWNYLSELYDSPDVGPLQKERVLKGMGCARKPDFLKILMETGISTSNYVMIEAVYSESSDGVEYAYNFFMDNVSRFLQTFSKKQIAKMLFEITEKLPNADMDKFNAVFASLDQEVQTEYNDIFAKARKTLRRNTKWVEDHEDEIKNIVRKIKLN